MLGTLPAECKSDWKRNIEVLEHVYNCTCNLAMGFSPYFLMYGTQPQDPIDVTFGMTLNLTSVPTSSKYVQK